MGGIRSKLGNVADKAKELGESVAEVAAEAGGTAAGRWRLLVVRLRSEPRRGLVWRPMRS